MNGSLTAGRSRLRYGMEANLPTCVIFAGRKRIILAL